MFSHVVRVMSGLKPTRGKIWTVPCSRKLSSSEAKLCVLLLASQKPACVLVFVVQSTASLIQRSRKYTGEGGSPLSCARRRKMRTGPERSTIPRVMTFGTAWALPPELSQGPVLHPRAEPNTNRTKLKHLTEGAPQLPASQAQSIIAWAQTPAKRLYPPALSPFHT